MRVIIKDNYTDICEWVSIYIKNKINHNRDNFVLGLPTGSTPIGVYDRFIDYHKKCELDFSNVITFNMDEYIGIPENHPQSYHYFMKHHLFNHINIEKKNINILNGNAEDLNKECNDYECKIHNMGIDLFLVE